MVGSLSGSADVGSLSDRGSGDVGSAVLSSLFSRYQFT